MQKKEEILLANLKQYPVSMNIAGFQSIAKIMLKKKTNAFMQLCE
jgi:hypothetical protein